MRGPAGRVPERSGGRSKGAGGRKPPANRGLGGEQVEGRQAVAELLAARTRPVVDVWMAQDLDRAPALDRIEKLAASARAPVRRGSRSAPVAAAATDAP